MAGGRVENPRAFHLGQTLAISFAISFYRLSSFISPSPSSHPVSGCLVLHQWGNFVTFVSQASAGRINCLCHSINGEGQLREPMLTERTTKGFYGVMHMSSSLGKCFSLNQTNGGGIAERDGHITWVCVFGLLRSLNEMDGKDLYSSNWGLLQVLPSRGHHLQRTEYMVLILMKRVIFLELRKQKVIQFRPLETFELAMYLSMSQKLHWWSNSPDLGK